MVRTPWSVSLYAICQDATPYCGRPAPGLICRRLGRVRPTAANENGPGNRGHWFNPSRAPGGSPDRICAKKPFILRGQRPKRGRSPLRMAYGCWRSKEAIRRLKRVLYGSTPMDAILEMFVLSFWCATVPLRIENNLRIPDANLKRPVCMAAIVSLHCNKIDAWYSTNIPDSKRPPESGGLCVFL